jgi:hypothetical protein
VTRGVVVLAAAAAALALPAAASAHTGTSAPVATNFDARIVGFHPPAGVNLAALVNRLSMICCTFSRSAWTAKGWPSAGSIVNVSRLARICGITSARTSSRADRTSKSASVSGT